MWFLHAFYFNQMKLHGIGMAWHDTWNISKEKSELTLNLSELRRRAKEEHRKYIF